MLPFHFQSAKSLHKEIQTLKENARKEINVCSLGNLYTTLRKEDSDQMPQL